MNAATVQLLDIPTKDIAEHPDNPRQHLGDLSDLAASIQAQGLLEPLVVEPSGEGVKKKYQLVAGHRRLAAAIQAGVKTLPAILHPASERGEQVERMLVENGQRVDLSPVEEGTAYQLLIDLDYKPEDIAAKVGRSKKAVTDRIKVTKLPGSTQAQILNRDLTLEDAVRMASFANDRDAMTRLDRAAQAGPIALATALEREKQARTERANFQRAERALKKRCTADGVPYVKVDDVEPECFVDSLLSPAQQREIGGDLRQVDDQDYYNKLIEWHKDCPGHALTIDEDEAVIGVCTSPYDHHGDELGVSPDEAVPAPTTDPEEQPQQAADEKALAELEARLRATAVVRRRFLGDVARSDAAEQIAREMVVGDFEPMLAAKHPAGVRQRRVFAQMLLPNASDKTLDSDDLPDKLRAALKATPLPALVVFRRLRLDAATDDSLDNPRTWLWRDAANEHSWVHQLVSIYKWEPTPEEQALIDGGDPAEVARTLCGDAS
ncbi:ParB/RepB/Spo0J family partition protein [Calidifontibacter sp. DB0510]|uniref:ParB/RepB/Spo0J family partition protein n=1 Tax=Metallococcus carri TaxID=1656884 RepID=A0A967B6V5_9MICO|nr:ParB/RepB/Spo0J family partition protein [Metallococcus carri]NHN55796.1 ParB/RepB/Spo0J family partition protein [Metallococcus carri]NOP38515.1 ParB/RepB/Spo0J family partition protein [Calidifontibacter sp. DB2511S]